MAKKTETQTIKVDFPTHFLHGKVVSAKRWLAPPPIEEWCWVVDVETPDGDTLPYAIHEDRGRVINEPDRPTRKPKTPKASKK